MQLRPLFKVTNAQGSDLMLAAFAVDEGGRIYVTADLTINQTPRAVVARLEPDGALDPAFGVVSDLGNGADQAGGIAITSDAVRVSFGWRDGTANKSGMALLQP